MRLNLLSFLLIIPYVLSALVTDYIVTTNVAGVVSTMTSIYDPEDKITKTKKTTKLTTPLITTSTTTPITPTTPVTTAITTATSKSSKSSKSTKPTTPATTATTKPTTTTKPITTGMVTAVITSSLDNGALTTYTTVIPLASFSTTSYVNSRHRPDPSTSVTPEPLTPVTTLSWQSWATITEGDTTYTTSLSPIIIWITVTTNGALATISTTYIQRFSTQYSTIAQPSSGSIGLGTISGEVGVVKPEHLTTIKYNNAFILQASHPILSICAILLSWLL
ncbi:Kre1p PWA37_002481 [Arxiozyma heterogenica]|uniref:Uncharacterized protein n=1 Tax=Arxiozyma heterogenica TaxID=278026 RepID=A0AAN7ZR83_9SACH|nr:hypothetical protein RI543_005096 [Kazachstania heterogenica]